tara:strand:- start:1098 stop:1289 length:192 start_codon:yes stop_codon:yes gene_type:complete
MFNNNKIQMPEMETKPISKNQDITRLVNFRLRKSDLDTFDEWCKQHHVSRTKGVETLIRALPQ